VTLDIDDTVDVAHGHQQLSLFNAHHDERCFMPIHVYDTATSRPVAILLRPGKAPSGHEVRSHARRLVRRIRQHWPSTLLTIRGDGQYRRIKPLYCWLRAVFADGAYNRVTALLACFLLGLALIVVSRPPGTKGFAVLPRCWIVERMLGWLGRWRRLSRDYEYLPDVSEAIVTVAMIHLMLHRAVHPNRKRLPAP